MAELSMTDGDCVMVSLPLSPVGEESPMQICSRSQFSNGVVLPGGHCGSPASSPAASVGGSPGKYIAPRLRRSASPAAPTASATVLTKRPLSMAEPLVWRNNPAEQRSLGGTTCNANYSPPSSSPPPPPPQQDAGGVLGIWVSYCGRSGSFLACAE
ncbi:unnamed protein product [Calypogeia fissa]